MVRGTLSPHTPLFGGIAPKTPNDWEKRGSYKYYQKGKLGEELSSEPPMIAPNPDYYHKTKIWGFRGLCPRIGGMGGEATHIPLRAQGSDFF